MIKDLMKLKVEAEAEGETLKAQLIAASINNLRESEERRKANLDAYDYSYRTEPDGHEAHIANGPVSNCVHGSSNCRKHYDTCRCEVHEYVVVGGEHRRIF